jgi:prepilin-type N-terminal cleavage/methylation domain-containing protein
MSVLRIRGFTLIELLIVVAIIAILAAIAVPNFLEAQVRAKVSRVKTDMRSLATALESYAVDYNHYPPGVNAAWEALDPVLDFFYWQIGFEWRLTTPIAYMTSGHIIDPFMPNRSGNPSSTNPKPATSYQYICLEPIGNSWMALMKLNSANDPWVRPFKGYCMSSFGPDRTQGFSKTILTCNAYEYFAMKCDADGNVTTDDPANKAWGLIYDATNGTLSGGEIGRWGGAFPSYCGAVNK